MYTELIKLSTQYTIRLYISYIIVARYDPKIVVTFNGRKMLIGDVTDLLFDKYDKFTRDW